MLKRALLPALLTALLSMPMVALADCGFAMSDDGITIVVGKKTNKCFSSSEFREAFKAQITAAMAEEDPLSASARRKKSFDERSARADKLWTIAERQYQATVPTAPYFGQK